MNNINSGNMKNPINTGDIGGNLNDTIMNIYKKNSYLEKYGGSVFVTALVLGFYVVYKARLNILNNIEPIKNNWAKEKCSPSVIPFAGMINAPEGYSKFVYTASNFSSCIRNILSGIVFDFFAPIYYIVSIIEHVIKVFVLAIRNIKLILDKIQQVIRKILIFIRDTIGKLFFPFKKILYSAIDAFSKIGGMFQAMVFVLIGVLNAFKAFISMWLMDMIIAVTILCVLIAILWLIPFPAPAWVMAAKLTATITVPIITMTIIVHIMRTVFQISIAAVVPLVPACFDGDTMVPMFNGKEKRIADIEIGDKLVDGGIVTANIKHILGDQKMYNLNGVLVTEKHSVILSDDFSKRHVLVEDHPDSKLVDNYYSDKVYCLNTTTKEIVINNIAFTDWDDLDEMDIVEIRNKCREQGIDGITKSTIHNHIDGGFQGDTLVDLEDGRSIPIKDVTINDILIGGERVTGVVEIDGKKVSKQYKYSFKDDSNNDVNIYGGPNLIIFDDESLGVVQSIDIIGKKIKKNDKLYHIITDKRTLQIKGIKFLDYNSLVEVYLENDKEELFSGLL